MWSVGSENYLTLVDYYSSYFEINKLPNIKSMTIINICKQHFSRYGIQSVLMSDNVPHYSSQDFEKFSEEYNFKYITSLPHYPQPNWKAEKEVQIANNIGKKSKLSKQNTYLTPLNYWNTPLEQEDSAARLLMGRRTRTTLPSAAKLLKPKLSRDAETNLKNKQKKQNHFCDRQAKLLKELEKEDTVRFNAEQSWQKAVVVAKSEQPRSYIIQARGQRYRRNRRRLIKRQVSPPRAHMQSMTWQTVTQTHNKQPTRALKHCHRLVRKSKSIGQHAEDLWSQRGTEVLCIAEKREEEKDGETSPATRDKDCCSTN